MHVNVDEIAIKVVEVVVAVHVLSLNYLVHDLMSLDHRKVKLVKVHLAQLNLYLRVLDVDDEH